MLSAFGATDAFVAVFTASKVSQISSSRNRCAGALAATLHCTGERLQNATKPGGGVAKRRFDCDKAFEDFVKTGSEFTPGTWPSAVQACNAPSGRKTSTRSDLIAPIRR